MPKTKLTRSNDPFSNVEEIPNSIRSSPSRKAKENVKYYRYGGEGKRYAEEVQDEADDENTFTDLSGFIVDDDASLSLDERSQESEEEHVQHQRRHEKDAGTADTRRSKQKFPRVRDQHLGFIDLDAEPTLLTSALEKLDLSAVPKFHVRAISSSAMPSPTKVPSTGVPDQRLSNHERTLSTPEPSNMSPAQEERSYFVTPPSSPSRPRLKPPSKTNRQIPQSPHRQSLDSFWSSEEINSWNDQYSPRKTPQASRRGIQRFLTSSDDEMDLLPRAGSPSPLSPNRGGNSATVSPSKQKPSLSKLRGKAGCTATEKRKAFDQSKHQLATDLLLELDDNICQGKLSMATARTGGVQIKWSKTLYKTAGRANWRRTYVCPGTTTMATFANIELAEKIIDSTERLINTLSHEFCHLANYEISNELADAHGKSWRKWVNKTMHLLQNHENALYQGVEITAKHNYKIDYRYVWLCVGSKSVDFITLTSEGCGMEYGRHSKSINPERERCARCKGILVQVKPTVKTRKAPVNKALKASPKKKSTLEEVLEIADETGVTQTMAVPYTTAEKTDGLTLGNCNSKTDFRMGEDAKHVGPTIVIDLTEFNNIEEDSGDLPPAVVCHDEVKREVLRPSAGNVIKNQVLGKLEVVDIVDLTDE